MQSLSLSEFPLAVYAIMAALIAQLLPFILCLLPLRSLHPQLEMIFSNKRLSLRCVLLLVLDKHWCSDVASPSSFSKPSANYSSYTCRRSFDTTVIWIDSTFASVRYAVPLKKPAVSMSNLLYSGCFHLNLPQLCVLNNFSQSHTHYATHSAHTY